MVVFNTHSTSIYSVQKVIESSLGSRQIERSQNKGKEKEEEEDEREGELLIELPSRD